MSVKTVFFHQNMNKISFYKFFMVHYDYLIKIVIVYHANFMKLYSHDGKTQFSQIFLGCIIFCGLVGVRGGMGLDKSPLLLPVVNRYMFVSCLFG